VKIYGHPWSINTRKVLMTLAEKGHEGELVLVNLPKGEHKQPDHMARHPFGKVPVLDDGFLLYESAAINRYLDRTLAGPPLVPGGAEGAARVDQWISVADSYFAPHAQSLVLETVFRRHLGGERNAQAIDAARAGMQPVLDAMDRGLASSAYLGGPEFSLADVHFMPYLEYLAQTGQGEHVEGRRSLKEWWARVSSRSAWQRVGRTGPQPYQAGITADMIERLLRR
jgi:glutathione S-transferase